MFQHEFEIISLKNQKRMDEFNRKRNKEKSWKKKCNKEKANKINAVSCDYILRETYAFNHICLFQLKKKAGVIGETGVLATRIVQRKEKDSVLQMILKNVQELTEIVLNFKKPNVQWMNAMVNKQLTAIKI